MGGSSSSFLKELPDDFPKTENFIGLENVRFRIDA